ncbi:MAG: PIN domain-containing protein [Actinomycetota bacterium]
MANAIGLRLADTSAWHAVRHPAVAELWEDALAEGLIVVCPQVELELLFSARSAPDYESIALELAALPHVPCGEESFTRALEVQRRLAHVGGLHHRSVKIPDLIIAAAAELADLPLWHYDEDFDRIAAITGQRSVWIARRGSL